RSDRVRVAEPVRALDGVVHVPAPVVLAHIAERGADSALCSHRVAACRKELGEAGGRQTAFGKAERGAQARASGPDDDDVVAVIDELVGAHGAAPKATLRTANTPAAAISVCANSAPTSVTVLAPAPCTESSTTTRTPSCECQAATSTKRMRSSAVQP